MSRAVHPNDSFGSKPEVVELERHVSFTLGNGHAVRRMITGLGCPSLLAIFPIWVSEYFFYRETKAAKFWPSVHRPSAGGGVSRPGPFLEIA
jgi:hypothetical protein